MSVRLLRKVRLLENVALSSTVSVLVMEEESFSIVKIIPTSAQVLKNVWTIMVRFAMGYHLVVVMKKQPHQLQRQY